MNKKLEPLPVLYRGIKDPDLLFDLVVFRAWLLGQGDQSIPVEESRLVLKHIKKLL